MNESALCLLSRPPRMSLPKEGDFCLPFSLSRLSSKVGEGVGGGRADADRQTTGFGRIKS